MRVSGCMGGDLMIHRLSGGGGAQSSSCSRLCDGFSQVPGSTARH